MGTSKNKSHVDKSIEEKIIDLSFYQLREFNEIELKHLGTRFDFLLHLRGSKMNEEPLKIFKKKHLKWENELKELDCQIDDVLHSMDFQMNEIEDINLALEN